MAHTPYTVLMEFRLVFAHHTSSPFTGTLTEFSRLLIPGGSSFWDVSGRPRLALFAHAAQTAYYVSVPEFSALCEKAAFTVKGSHPQHREATTTGDSGVSQKINAPHD